MNRSWGHKGKKNTHPLPEQELTVKVGDVDGVHIDDVNVFEAGQGQVLEDFTAQTTGTNDQNLG